MRKPTAFVAIAVIVALSLIALVVDRQSVAQAPEKPILRGGGALIWDVNAQKIRAGGWEYKTIAQNPDAEISEGSKSMLNRLGNDGWELCAAVQGERQDRPCYFVLKRPRLGGGDR